MTAAFYRRGAVPRHSEFRILKIYMQRRLPPNILLEHEITDIVEALHKAPTNLIGSAPFYTRLVVVLLLILDGGRRRAKQV